MKKPVKKTIHARDFFAEIDSESSAKNGENWENFDFSRVRRNIHARKSDKKSQNFSSTINFRENFWTIFFAGLISGISFWFLFLIAKNLVIFPLFCGAPDGGEICARRDEISNLVSAILVGAILVYFFAMQKIARGVLAAFATTILFFALLPILISRNTVFSGIIFAIFGGISALFFAKLSQIKQKFFALFLMAIFLVIFWTIVR